MDDELQRLRRKAAAAPQDPVAARALDRALERAGERPELQRRFRMAFQCPLRFEELAPTGDPLERRCDHCRRTVRHVRSRGELAQRVAEGGCVAVPRRLLDRAADELARDERLHSASQPGGPCLVATDLRCVDPEREPPTPDALALLPPSRARNARALPLAVVDGVLEVAFADDTDVERQARDLWLGPVRVRPVLASPEAIDRALARLPIDEPWEQVDVGFAAPSA